ncbi:AMP-binding protein [Streptomyces sp. CAI-121]|uniref:AMP-binding protein n=1 Tax=unclassified Streptomyces TaxID=2593676 RepID=UPI001587F3F4|nr:MULTISPECIES: AMP-binding protein [unclassified Streptomyces]NUV68131.1 AMP-binding protein [Streptomyces sp. CAI-121]NUW14311.1 AMP-binding protein [Streptomyces sp. CAI-68]
MAESAEYALHSRFLRGLAVSPDGIAARAGKESRGYAEMHDLALRWGGSLARTGSPAVGVLAARGLTAYTGILAALYAGAAVVPLRPDFPASRTRQIIEASGLRTVVADDAGLAVLPKVLDGIGEMSVLAPDAADGATVPGVRLLPAHAAALDEPAPVKPDDPAYYLFTSGSTGRPKGVALTHGGTEHYFRLADERYDFGPGDVFSQAFELNFDCGAFDLFCAWGAGATVVTIPPGAYLDLPSFVAQQGLTVWFSTPSAIDLVRRVGGLGANVLAGLRWSLFAGEALKCRDAEEWQRSAPASVLENLYGPTELTITIAAHRWSSEHSPAAAVNGLSPIGPVHRGHHHLLLDDDGEPCEDEGELCVSGPQLAAGYLDPGDDQGRFFERDGRRWYRTGDRVRRLDGDELVYLGRRDAQVQIQGWRVELAEVEQALRLCDVADAVAVAVTGATGTELAAFYTGDPVPTAGLVGRLRAHLPAGVLPKHYHHLPEFPLNANKKVDRLRLAAYAQDLIDGADGGTDFSSTTSSSSASSTRSTTSSGTADEPATGAGEPR